jgi:hypothetical protein
LAIDVVRQLTDAVRRPHIKIFFVPGSGLSDDGSQWLPARADFFVPVKALSIVFRDQFRDAMDRAGLFTPIDPAVWRRGWVVHSGAVGDGRASLKYLAPYVFRVASSDRRIVSYDDGRVTFSYRRSGSSHGQKMTVDANEFIRRFLQHVLPAGFQKVRHYGFLSSNSPKPIEAVCGLVSLYSALIFRLLTNVPQAEPRPPRHEGSVGSRRSSPYGVPLFSVRFRSFRGQYSSIRCAR